MEKIKDTEKIKIMLQNGETIYIDPKNESQYSIYASCPNDGYDCSPSRFERAGLGEGIVKISKITRVVFRCPICDNVFKAQPEDMFLL